MKALQMSVLKFFISHSGSFTGYRLSGIER